VRHVTSRGNLLPTLKRATYHGPTQKSSVQHTRSDAALGLPDNSLSANWSPETSTVYKKQRKSTSHLTVRSTALYSELSRHNFRSDNRYISKTTDEYQSPLHRSTNLTVYLLVNLTGKFSRLECRRTKVLFTFIMS